MRLGLLLLLLVPTTAHAQWEIQDSGTTASLRGIVNVGNGVAWASGTGGTVLRTGDGGKHWQACAMPPDAAKLDFRGVQAFDAKTAIVMSSGKGDLSRLYKTSDGCATWKLVFTNPDKDGFWDAIQAHVVRPGDTQLCPGVSGRAIAGVIMGDPSIHKTNPYDTVTRSSFYLASFRLNSGCSDDALNQSAGALFSGPGEAAFAASNSVLLELAPTVFWMTTNRELIQYETGFTSPHHDFIESICGMDIPVRRDTPSRGVFSMAVRLDSIEDLRPYKISHGPACRRAVIVAVGGDYEAPDEQVGTAAFTAGSKKFRLSLTSPGGYRSAVAYDASAKTWITVGPNGTDISTDDGRNWRALTPSAEDAPDADKNWNALSLPFVVGPKGRIGVLKSGVLKSQK